MICFVLVGVSPGNVNLNSHYIKTKRKEKEKGREEEWKPCGGFVLLFASLQFLFIRISNVRKLTDILIIAYRRSER